MDNGNQMVDIGPYIKAMEFGSCTVLDASQMIADKYHPRLLPYCYRISEDPRAVRFVTERADGNLLAVMEDDSEVICESLKMSELVPSGNIIACMSRTL